MFEEYPYANRVFKYFVGYKNNDVASLCVVLPKMSGYIKNFNDFKTLSFLVEDEKLSTNTIKYGAELNKL